ALLARGQATPDKPVSGPPAGVSQPEGAAEPAKPADPPATGAKPAEADQKAGAERGRLLEAVGCLTSAHCFQTYLNIGFIADGKAKGTYTDADARKVLDS